MFTWPHDQPISAMIRKELGFDAEHKFRIWKRSGTFSTTAISHESSFKDISVDPRDNGAWVDPDEHPGSLMIEEVKEHNWPEIWDKLTDPTKGNNTHYLNSLIASKDESLR